MTGVLHPSIPPFLFRSARAGRLGPPCAQTMPSAAERRTPREPRGGAVPSSTRGHWVEKPGVFPPTDRDANDDVLGFFTDKKDMASMVQDGKECRRTTRQRLIKFINLAVNRLLETSLWFRLDTNEPLRPDSACFGMSMVVEGLPWMRLRTGRLHALWSKGLYYSPVYMSKKKRWLKANHCQSSIPMGPHTF